MASNETDFDKRVREQGLKTMQERTIEGPSGTSTRITKKSDSGTATVQSGRTTGTGFKATKKARVVSIDKDVKAEDISIPSMGIKSATEQRTERLESQLKRGSGTIDEPASKSGFTGRELKQIPSTRERSDRSRRLTPISQDIIESQEQAFERNQPVSEDDNIGRLQRNLIMDFKPVKTLTSEDFERARGDEGTLAQQTRRVEKILRVQNVDERGAPQSVLQTGKQFSETKFEGRPLTRATAKVQDVLSRSEPGQAVLGFTESTGIKDITGFVTRNVEDIFAEDSTDPNIILQEEVLNFSPGGLQVRPEDRPKTRQEVRQIEAFSAQEAQLGRTKAQELGRVGGMIFDLATITPADVTPGQALGISKRFKGVPKTTGIVDDTIEITGTGRKTGTTTSRNIDPDIISPTTNTKLRFKEKSRFGKNIDTTIDVEGTTGKVIKTQKQGDIITKTSYTKGDDFSITQKFRNNKQIGTDIVNPPLSSGKKINIEEIISSDATDITLKRQGELVREQSKARVSKVTGDLDKKRKITGEIEDITRSTKRTAIIEPEELEKSTTLFRVSDKGKPRIIEVEGSIKSRIPETRTGGKTTSLDFEDVISKESKKPDLRLDLDKKQFTGRRDRDIITQAIPETEFETAQTLRGTLKIEKKPDTSRVIDVQDIFRPNKGRRDILIRSKKGGGQLTDLRSLDADTTLDTALRIRQESGLKKGLNIDISAITTKSKVDTKLATALGLLGKTTTISKTKTLQKKSLAVRTPEFATVPTTEIITQEPVTVQDTALAPIQEQDFLLDTETITTSKLTPLPAIEIGRPITQPDAPKPKVPLPLIPIGLPSFSRLFRGRSGRAKAPRKSTEFTVVNKVLDISTPFKRALKRRAKQPSTNNKFKEQLRKRQIMTSNTKFKNTIKMPKGISPEKLQRKLRL